MYEVFIVLVIYSTLLLFFNSQGKQTSKKRGEGFCRYYPTSPIKRVPRESSRRLHTARRATVIELNPPRSVDTQQTKKPLSSHKMDPTPSAPNPSLLASPPELSPLEQEVLEEYERLAENMKKVTTPPPSLTNCALWGLGKRMDRMEY